MGLALALRHTVSIQNLLQVLSRIRVLQFRNRFGWTCPDKVAPAITTLGPQIDDPVRRLDDFEIVLDDNDRAARINEPPKGGQQFADVVKMQARSRLIENIKGLPFSFRGVAAL